MSDTMDMAAGVAATLRAAGVEPPPTPAAPEATDDEGNALPMVELPRAGRMLSAFAKEVGGIMRSNGIYAKDGVAAAIDPVTRRMEFVSAERFRSYAEKNMVPFMWQKRGKDSEMVACSMKVDVARAVLASDQFLALQRPLRRMLPVRCPVLRADGRIELLEEGYDNESQTLTLPGGPEYREMPPDQARSIILDLLSECTFADRTAPGEPCRSLAVWAAGLLSLFAIGLLSPSALIPALILTANKRGAGKSMLGKAILLPLYGEMVGQTLGRDEAELRKVLDGAALAGATYLFFDNVKTKMASESLEAFITLSGWGGRIMGTQRTFVAKKQCMVIASANAAEVSPDISRRAIFCELHVEQADIRARKFKREIDERFLLNPSLRGEILSACWALVRNWDAKGRPAGPTKIPTFEEWSRVIGGIVHANGLGDPAEKPNLVLGGDRESQEMRSLVLRLGEMIPPGEQEEEWSFDEIVSILRENSWLEDRTVGRKIKDGGGEVFELNHQSRVRLGRFLERYQGTVFDLEDGRQIRFGRKGSKNHRAFVVKWEVPQ